MESYIEEKLIKMIGGEKKRRQKAIDFIENLQEFLEKNEFEVFTNDENFVIKETDLASPLTMDTCDKDCISYGLWLSPYFTFFAVEPHGHNSVQLVDLKGTYFWHYVDVIVNSFQESISKMTEYSKEIASKI